ncbi:MAG: transposase, partial [Thermodesulfobacteriota bacterium]|nr:transposase [Thermodesulfobacteriota bacterium]
MDETSRKRGHNYVSLFVDLDTPKVVFATEGKDASTVKRFKQDLADHNGNPEAIEEICSDMSPSFISGVEKYFSNAHLTFNKFHIMKVIDEAFDEVRRQEQKDHPEEVFRTRYIWLKNAENLKASQAETLDGLSVKRLNLKTSRAYHIKLNVQELFNQPVEYAKIYLTKWYFWATHRRFGPIKEAAYKIKRHWDGVLQWFNSGVNNGIL